MEGGIILIITILSLLSCLRVESKIMLMLFLTVSPIGGGAFRVNDMEIVLKLHNEPP